MQKQKVHIAILSLSLTFFGSGLLLSQKQNPFDNPAPSKSKSSRVQHSSKKLQQENAKEVLNKLGIAFTTEAFFEEVKKGNIQNVRLFITAGMNPDVRDSSHPLNPTALMHAAARDYVEIGSFLLKVGADKNARRLIDGGYSYCEEGPNEEGETKKWGNTVLMVAAGSGRPKMTSLLISAGADVHAVCRERRDANALDDAMQFIISPHDDKEEMTRERRRDAFETIRLLLKAGADPNRPQGYDRYIPFTSLLT